MYRKIFIRYVLILCGVGLVALAVFALQLGIDHNPEWGPRRFQMVGLGLFLAYVGASYFLAHRVALLLRNWQDRFNDLSCVQFIKRAGQNARAKSQEFIQHSSSSSPAAIFRRTPWFNRLAGHKQSIGLILVGLFVLWLYVWIVTVGRYDDWPSGKNYYWLLAQAFRNGQTYLLVDPPQELLNLEDPYDHHQREGLEYLWDTTLYNGKYYMYWGPVPGVISAIVSAFTSGRVTDTSLVFAFVVGTALFSVLLLRATYREFKYPGWLFWCGVIASTINVPLIWLLTRPTVYEASIAGGQFFLMAGLYFAFCAFRDTGVHKGCMALSAIALGLAGGTRVNLLASGAVLTVLLGWQIYVTHQKKLKDAIPSLAALMLPLAVIMASFLWYNYARFGSIFELGHRYQLTGPALPANYEDISSANYIVPNVFTYIFRLPVLSAEFPYFTVPWIKQDMWPFFIRIPEHYYYTEPTASILFVVPLVGLTGLLMVRIGWLMLNGENSSEGSGLVANSRLFRPFLLILSAYVFIQMSVLLVFISSAMRYLFDIAPALIVLCVLFVAGNLDRLARTPSEKRLLMFSWVLITALTVLAGVLIGLTGDRNHFLNQNPRLYYQLQNWLP